MHGATIRTVDLVVGRGDQPFTAPLALVVRPGEALAVTGSNGAGKSTLIRTLAGLVAPLGGSVLAEGASAEDGEAARHAGEAAHYLGHRNGLGGAATLAEALSFAHRLLGGSLAETPGAVRAALEAYALEDLGAIPVRHLSAGQQRRAALARLLVRPRPFWLLDEPTGALDAVSVERFHHAARAHLEHGGAIVAATHLPLPFRTAALDLDASGVQADEAGPW